MLTVRKGIHAAVRQRARRGAVGKQHRKQLCCYTANAHACRAQYGPYLVDTYNVNAIVVIYRFGQPRTFSLRRARVCSGRWQAPSFLHDKLHCQPSWHQLRAEVFGKSPPVFRTDTQATVNISPNASIWPGIYLTGDVSGSSTAIPVQRAHKAHSIASIDALLSHHRADSDCQLRLA
jgi:hypothetical protein